MKIKLFLDCDGVLADFDRKFFEITGIQPRKFDEIYGAKKFWQIIREHQPPFFASLDLMSDALKLWAGVKHLNPTILTGMPLGNWAHTQKVQWAARHFPDLPIITCLSANKRDHMDEYALNIIIDDDPKHRDKWEEHDGIWILHYTAEQSLKELEEVIKECSEL